MERMNMDKFEDLKLALGRRDFLKGATGGAAALLATRAGDALAQGVTAYTLTADEVLWDAGGGKMVNAYAYAVDGGPPSVPGATLRARAGDILQITVVNNLSEETTVHWHGVHPIPNGMDGVPFVTQPPIAANGGSFVYTFPAPPPGTYVYHTHFNVLDQLARGLYGLLVVEDRLPGTRSANPHGQRAHERAYNRELPLVLGEFPDSIVVGGGDVALINGKSFYGLGAVGDPTMLNRLIFPMRRGERVLFRVWNASNEVHPMHTHGMKYIVVAADGMDLEVPIHRHNMAVSPGETYDIIVHADTPGAWLFHCHNIEHVVEGMVAVNIVA